MNEMSRASQNSILGAVGGHKIYSWRLWGRSGAAPYAFMNEMQASKPTMLQSGRTGPAHRWSPNSRFGGSAAFEKKEERSWHYLWPGLARAWPGPGLARLRLEPGQARAGMAKAQIGLGPAQPVPSWARPMLSSTGPTPSLVPQPGLARPVLGRPRPGLAQPGPGLALAQAEFGPVVPMCGKTVKRS